MDHTHSERRRHEKRLAFLNELRELFVKYDGEIRIMKDGAVTPIGCIDFTFMNEDGSCYSRLAQGNEAVTLEDLDFFIKQEEGWRH